MGIRESFFLTCMFLVIVVSSHELKTYTLYYNERQNNGNNYFRKHNNKMQYNTYYIKQAKAQIQRLL